MSVLTQKETEMNGGTEGKRRGYLWGTLAAYFQSLSEVDPPQISLSWFLYA